MFPQTAAANIYFQKAAEKCRGRFGRGMFERAPSIKLNILTH